MHNLLPKGYAVRFINCALELKILSESSIAKSGKYKKFDKHIVNFKEKNNRFSKKIKNYKEINTS